MASFEEQIRRIVREEVAAALSRVRVTADLLGEEVELVARIADAQAPAGRQGDRQVQRGIEAAAVGDEADPDVADDADGIAPLPVPRPITPAFLRDVATVYREAVEAGRPPNRAIQDRYGRSRSAVSQWLRQAREAELLPPTEPGRVSTFPTGIQE